MFHQILIRDRHRTGHWKLGQDLFDDPADARAFGEKHYKDREWKIVTIDLQVVDAGAA